MSQVSELPSWKETQGIHRWAEVLGFIIRRAPTAQRLAVLIKKGLPAQFWVKDENTLSGFERFKLCVTMIQPLEDRPGQYSFAASRLFPDGQITLAGGFYDEVRRTGKLLVKAFGCTYEKR